MTLKFFIDECLTPSLVAVAKRRELYAVFGPYFGKGAWQDRSIAEFAFENDLIAVTNNRRDFLREYARMEIHPGLVVIIPKGDKLTQIEWFAAVLDFLQALDEPPINKLVEIDAAGRITMIDGSRSP